MSYSDAYHVVPSANELNMLYLDTNAKTNLGDAINEIYTDAAAANAALTNAYFWTRTLVPAAGPIALNALPTGAHITNVKVVVTTAYPASTVFQLGDHSGSSGALAATSISSGTGVTLTATGVYNLPSYALPVGALSATVTGGAGGSGACVVLVEYIMS